MTRRRGCLPAQKQTKYPAIPKKIIKYTKIRAPYCSHNPKSPADCPAEGRPTGCHRKPWAAIKHTTPARKRSWKGSAGITDRINSARRFTAGPQFAGLCLTKSSMTISLNSLPVSRIVQTADNTYNSSHESPWSQRLSCPANRRAGCPGKRTALRPRKTNDVLYRDRRMPRRSDRPERCLRSRIWHWRVWKESIEALTSGLCSAKKRESFFCPRMGRGCSGTPQRRPLPACLSWRCPNRLCLKPKPFWLELLETAGHRDSYSRHWDYRFCGHASPCGFGTSPVSS